MKNLASIVFFICFSLSLQGQNANNEYTFKVLGNCDMCKDRIEAACKRAGAAVANWDKNTKMLTVQVKSEKQLQKVKRYVVAVGHDLEDVKADDKAYKRLHQCCKYDRE